MHSRVRDQTTLTGSETVMSVVHAERAMPLPQRKKRERVSQQSKHQSKICFEAPQNSPKKHFPSARRERASQQRKHYGKRRITVKQTRAFTKAFGAIESLLYCAGHSTGILRPWLLKISDMHALQICCTLQAPQINPHTH